MNARIIVAIPAIATLFCVMGFDWGKLSPLKEIENLIDQVNAEYASTKASIRESLENLAGDYVKNIDLPTYLGQKIEFVAYWHANRIEGLERAKEFLGTLMVDEQYEMLDVTIAAVNSAAYSETLKAFNEISPRITKIINDSKETSAIGKDYITWSARFLQNHMESLDESEKHPELEEIIQKIHEFH